MFDRETEIFIRDFAKEVVAENAAIFAGAGLSVPAGFVNWKGLLHNAIEELGLDAEKETDLISVAQFHCNVNGGNRSRLNQALIDEFSKRAIATENHKILARLPINTYWTTNYDKLIEEAIAASGKIPDVKYTVPQLAVTRTGRDAVVYKMHGDVDHPNQAILTKDDYESYHLRMGPFIENLSGDLVSKTFLFIGFSFTDPNLDYVLSRVRTRYSNNQRRHYCFMKKPDINDAGTEADLEYMLRKQALFIGDLLRFNIKTILVDSYNDITSILREIEKIYRSKTAFISGSAHDYGSWGREKSELFLGKLSASIIDMDVRVISGFGVGVGSAVISGALEHIYIRLKESSSRRLILKPFPQTTTGSTPLRELWTQYRREIAALSGLAIFVFGNKLKDDNVILADGLREEYALCKDAGAIIIPIGATGYVSKEIWEEALSDLVAFYGAKADLVRDAFMRIGDETSDPEIILDAAISMVRALTRI